MGAAGSVRSARHAAGRPDLSAVAAEMETGYKGTLIARGFVVRVTTNCISKRRSVHV